MKLDKLSDNEVHLGEDFAILGMISPVFFIYLLLYLRKRALYRRYQLAGHPRGPQGACARGLHHQRGEGRAQFLNNIKI